MISFAAGNTFLTVSIMAEDKSVVTVLTDSRFRCGSLRKMSAYRICGHSTNHCSGYLHWDQLVHAEDWLLFEKNIGAYICIDEVALSRGELYTVLTNKEAHGGKGSMIAIIKGTDGSYGHFCPA